VIVLKKLSKEYYTMKLIKNKISKLLINIYISLFITNCTLFSHILKQKFFLCLYIKSKYQKMLKYFKVATNTLFRYQQLAAFATKAKPVKSIVLFGTETGNSEKLA